MMKMYRSCFLFRATSSKTGYVHTTVPSWNILTIFQQLVSPSERQWAHSNDLLTVHPEVQTDAFILYIKAAILLSKVKTFNLRFRSRHFSGDGDTGLAYSTFQTDEPVDPRNSMAFIDLDVITTSFVATFPPHLRNPLSKETMDCTLFAAACQAHVYVS